jgi:hypothetical protein
MSTFLLVKRTVSQAFMGDNEGGSGPCNTALVSLKVHSCNVIHYLIQHYVFPSVMPAGSVTLEATRLAAWEIL